MGKIRRAYREEYGGLFKRLTKKLNGEKVTSFKSFKETYKSQQGACQGKCNRPGHIPPNPNNPKLETKLTKNKKNKDLQKKESVDKEWENSKKGKKEMKSLMSQPLTMDAFKPFSKYSKASAPENQSQ